MSVEVQRPTTVVSTFNSYHDSGLPPREWLTAGKGEAASSSQPVKRTQSASPPVKMHAYARTSQSTPDAVRAQRAVPTASSQPDAEPASGTRPRLCAWVDDPPADEAFSDAASPPTAGSDCSDLYADCRDCSAASSVSTQSPDDNLQCFEEGMRRLRRMHSEAQLPSTDWHARYLEEVRRRKVAEEAAAELRDQRALMQLRMRFLEADRRQRPPREITPTVQASASEAAEVLVARIVSAAIGRAVSAADTEERWRQEVQLLRRRIERMGRMEEAIERVERADAAARETLKRRILHAALAVSCVTAGLAGAIVFMTRVRAQD